jgi:predicted GNAT family acetyltransferase
MTEIKPSIQHDKINKKFFMVFENGDEAVIQYEEIEPGLLDFYHTFTPPSQRGKGIAQKIAKVAMDYVVENNLKVKPTCPYLQDNFLPSHLLLII